MFERYSFVAVTTVDLGQARHFWVDVLGCTVIDEKPGEFFMVDAGGLRLCVDLADGNVHKTGGSDPVIGLKVASVSMALERLAAFGVSPSEGPVSSPRGQYAQIRDPDGHTIILTEND
jgi:catechol 2,3-dioxygenase-like lactoylglutathione lyase family enzyme